MPKKKPIKKFTRSEATRFGDDLRTELTIFANKYGLNIEFGNGKFSSEMYKMPVTFTLNDNASQSVADDRRKEFEQNAALFGMKPEHFGKPIQLHDGTYIIAGCKPRASKNTILVEKTHTRSGSPAKPGQIFVMPHGQVQSLFGLGEAGSVPTTKYDIID